MGKKPFLKKAAFILVCIITTASFTGCEKIGTEMVDLMIIQGIGVDKTENGYKVTIEAINNAKNTFLGGQSNAQSISKIYVSEGGSISEALDSAVRISGKRPLYAHNRVLVIGEDTAKDGIVNLLDFFIRDYNAKPTVYLAIARGVTAQNVLLNEMCEDVILSQLLESVLVESYEHGKAFRVRIFEAVNFITDETEALCIPAILIKNDKEERLLTINGTAVFNKENKMIGYLNETETLGSVLLNGNLEEAIFNFDLKGGRSVALKITKAGIKTRVRYENNKVCADIDVKVQCSIKEIDSEVINNLEAETIDEIEIMASRRITEISAAAINAARNELKADIFRLGRRLWITDSDSYETVKNRWADVFGSSDININAKVIIKRMGEEAIF